MNRKRISVLAAALLCAAGCVSVRHAREASLRNEPLGVAPGRGESGKLDLRGADLPFLVDFAVTNRPSVTAALLAVEDARLQLKLVAADAPVLSGTPWNGVSASASLGHAEQSAARHFDKMHSRTKGSASGALSLDLLLWDFGRNSARAKSGAEKVVAAEMALVDEGFAVFEEVSSAWFALRRNDALLEVALAKEQNYAEHFGQTEERLAVGEAQELDVLRARLDLAKARESVVAASNDVAVAGAQLMAALGIDASRGTCDEVLGRREVSLEVFSPSFHSTSSTAEDVFGWARSNAPAMAVARARLRAASADLDYAVRDLYPSISASLSLNWADPLWYWRWGVSGVQSLFSGFRTTTAIDRAIVALDTAATSVMAEEQNLSRDIAVAVAERDSAREAFASAQVSVAEAKRNLETVAERYGVGDVNRVEYTDAASDYAEAQGGLVTAFYRGQTAESKLFRVAGEPPAFVEDGNSLEKSNNKPGQNDEQN